MNYIQRVISIVGAAILLNGWQSSIKAYPIHTAVIQASDAKILVANREKITSTIDQLFERARALYFKGQSQHSEQIYRQIIEEFPNNEAAYLGLGDALSSQNWLEEAAEAYQTALKINANSALGYSELGYILSRLERHQEAIDSYKKAIKLEPGNVHRVNSLGAAFQWAGRLDEAVEAYKKAIQIDRKYVYAYRNLGSVLSTQKKYDEAIDAYRRATQIDPQYISGFIGWGQVLTEQELFAEAIEVYKGAIASSKTCNAELFSALEEAYRKQAKFKEAMQANNNAAQCGGTNFKHDPNFLSTTLMQNNIQNLINHPENISIQSSENNSAIATQIKDIYPNLILIYTLLSNPHSTINIEEINIKKIETAVANHPNLAISHTLLGLALLLKDRASEAVPAFKQALYLSTNSNEELTSTTSNEVFPEDDEDDNDSSTVFSNDSNAQFIYLLGCFIVANGQQDLVISAIDSIIEQKSNSSSALAYFYIAKNLNEMGRPKAAESFTNHAYTKHPNNPYIILTKAIESISKGDIQKAKEYSEQVKLITNDPSKLLRSYIV